MAATVDDYIKAYWSTLEASLDAIDTDLYDDLKTSAAAKILNYNIDHLTTQEKIIAEALIVCVDAAGFSSIAGFSDSRHFASQKIDKMSVTKTEGSDHFLGELRRYIPEYGKDSSTTTRANISQSYRTNNYYIGKKLDMRDEPFRESEPDTLRSNWTARLWGSDDE